jgi:hypothetical protein
VRVRAGGWGGCRRLVPRRSDQARGLPRGREGSARRFHDVSFIARDAPAWHYNRRMPDYYRGHQARAVNLWTVSKRVIVWPEELASGKLRFPPPWRQRP